MRKRKVVVDKMAEGKKAEPKTVVVPVGTRIMVETIDMLDSSRQKATSSQTAATRV